MYVSTSGRRDAKRWSSTMCSRVMPMATWLMYGTGLRGIADVLVEGLGVGGRLPEQPAARRQVEVLRHGLRRGPRVHAAPLVAPGLEDERLGQLRVGLALQVEREERELDLVAVELGGLRPEAHVAEAVAVAAATSRRGPRAP